MRLAVVLVEYAGGSAVQDAGAAARSFICLEARCSYAVFATILHMRVALTTSVHFASRVHTQIAAYFSSLTNGKCVRLFAPQGYIPSPSVNARTAFVAHFCPVSENVPILIGAF